MKKIIILIALLVFSVGCSLQTRTVSDELYYDQKENSYDHEEFLATANEITQEEDSVYIHQPRSNPYEEVLVNNYDEAWQMRMDARISPWYGMNNWDVYFSDVYWYATSYDPMFYNVIIMGDKVWVEPHWMSSHFNMRYNYFPYSDNSYYQNCYSPYRYNNFYYYNDYYYNNNFNYSRNSNNEVLRNNKDNKRRSYYRIRKSSIRGKYNIDRTNYSRKRIQRKNNIKDRKVYKKIQKIHKKNNSIYNKRKKFNRNKNFYPQKFYNNIKNMNSSLKNLKRSSSSNKDRNRKRK